MVDYDESGVLGCLSVDGTGRGYVCNAQLGCCAFEVWEDILYDGGFEFVVGHVDAVLLVWVDGVGESLVAARGVGSFGLFFGYVLAILRTATAA